MRFLSVVKDKHGKRLQYFFWNSIFSSVVSPASACPVTATGSATTRTSPADTASPAPPTTAMAAAPAKSISQKKKFASE